MFMQNFRGSSSVVFTFTHPIGKIPIFGSAGFLYSNRCKITMIVATCLAAQCELSSELLPECSVFRVPYSVFRVPYSVFRVPC